ncbi:MAG: hypothetical protein KatS3mg076_2006 [Candidatus Binatia bacterium]|nr:MAG: hypothetical protein KatS3mg076_2006 [Candidatus Binatia bacterium]
MATETLVGRVTHYYDRIGVAIIELTEGDLAVGDTIHVKGHTTDFTDTVRSMQVEHADVQRGSKGQQVGVKVKERAREHDQVFKVAD